MNPLVVRAAELTPNAEDATWFAIDGQTLDSLGSGNAPTSEALKLPFEITGVVTPSEGGHPTEVVPFVFVQMGDSVLMHAIPTILGSFPVITFNLYDTDGAITAMVEDSFIADVTKRYRRIASGEIDFVRILETMRDFGLRLLKVITSKDAPTIAYKGQAAPNNAKRIRKGKKPMFTWTTVVIAPKVVPRSEPKGGTHASPRLHDRRGHWRRYKSGKEVWVRNCKVGHAKNGIGFHDYEVRTC